MSTRSLSTGSFNGDTHDRHDRYYQLASRVELAEKESRELAHQLALSDSRASELERLTARQMLQIEDLSTSLMEKERKLSDANGLVAKEQKEVRLMVERNEKLNSRIEHLQRSLEAARVEVKVCPSCSERIRNESAELHRIHELEMELLNKEKESNAVKIELMGRLAELEKRVDATHTPNLDNNREILELSHK